MSSEFTYYAFISYSHKDEAWAKWIQEAIERYRLPAIIRKEVKKPLPKKIQPVFLDQTDLGVGKLVDNLHQELEKSRFLIVVCSPNSAQPNAEGRHFIEDEVTHFCSLGREKQIIPVIVEGTPQTAFCPKLKKSDILAIDATKEPKPKILNDLVATILGLRRDELWNRERRRQRRQRIRRTILGALVGVLVAFGGLFAWDANRTVKNYYADYVDSFGLPEGIFKLKKSDLKGRHIHYRFEYSGFQHGRSPHADSADWCIWSLLGFRRRLVRVVQANSHGYPVAFDYCMDDVSHRPAIQCFKYDDGRLNEIKCGRFVLKDRFRIEMRIELWNLEKVNAREWWNEDNIITNGLIKFFKDDGQLSQLYLNYDITTQSRWSFENPNYASVVQKAVLRDSSGRSKSSIFLDSSGQITSDGDGLCGCAYEYDVLGRIVTLKNLCPNSKGDGFVVGVNRKGVKGKRYAYHEASLLKVENFGEDNLPIMDQWGNIGFEGRYDKFGNLIEMSSVGDVVTKTRLGYDENGNTIQISWHNVKGNAILDDSHSYSIVKYFYDEDGRILKAIYYDVDGSFAENLIGFAEVQWQISGNVVKELYFNNNGQQMLNRRTGVAEVCREYDFRGNIVKESYYNTNGDKIKCIGSGYAEIQWVYDSRGNEVKKVYFDANSKLLKTEYMGESGRFREYDKRGNVISESYFDSLGTPSPCPEGYVQVRYEYNEKGKKIKESYHDCNGALSLSARLGVAEIRWEFDQHGNKIKESYYGIDGKPASNKNSNVAEYHWRYDNRGNKISESYYDVNKMPTNYGGYAEVRWSYNNARKPITESYYDGKGKPIAPGVLGVAEKRYEYDSRGYQAKVSYFDVLGKPTLRLGYAEARYEFDKLGRCDKESFFGTDGKPIVLDGGYSIVKREREDDEFGHRIRYKESYYDAEGCPILFYGEYAAEEVKYDINGNIVSKEYYGVDGQHIDLRKVIVVDSILPDSMAACLGVQKGDIWCRLGAHNVLMTGNTQDAIESIHACRNTENELIFARKLGDVYEIRSLKFPLGATGIRLNGKNISDYYKLEEAYKAFCKKVEEEVP